VKDSVPMSDGVLTATTATDALPATVGDTNGAPASPGSAPKRRRRGLRIVLFVFLAVFVLLAGAIGYLYWQFSLGKRIDLPPNTLDPKVNEATISREPIVTIPTPTAGVPSAGVDPTGDGSGTPEPGVPNTVPGLPGPNVPAVEDTTPLPPIDITGLDPTLAPLNTLPADQLKIGPLIDTSSITAVGGPNTLNFLVVGSDDRSTVPKGQEHIYGNVIGSRSDTIMILRVDPDARKAWVLSIPRDLYVRMPGTNEFDRINAASGRSDALLVKTIQENLNIPIQHMMKVDFVGFQKVVSAVGGVKICFKFPTRDVKSGLDQKAGCNVLTGRQATGYVRSRYFEEQMADGSWKRDGRADLGRIERQQKFMRAGMEAAVNKGFRSPTKLHATLTKLRSAVAFDPTLGFTDVLSLADKLRSFDPDSLESQTVPGDPFTIDKKAVLKLNVKRATPIVGQFGHRPTPKPAKPAKF
jgi:LCP family protein required for cell wall assembly